MCESHPCPSALWFWPRKASSTISSVRARSSLSLLDSSWHAVLSYLISPNASHRFVGYLEEQAVHT
jgi:hypothetical protein